MQEYLKIGGKLVKQPDVDGYTVNFATTSTSDSDRTQDLVMHNTPVGTIASYGLKWSDLTPAEATRILSEVLDKSSFLVHYFDVKDGTWKDGSFYASNFSISPINLRDGKERYSNLSFNIVGVTPI